MTLVMVFGQSCSYENEEELFPPIDPNACDVSMVSYQQHVAPIIVDNCFICHSGSDPVAGFVLENYEALSEKAESGILFCAINHDDGCQNMPRNRPKLKECDILTIKTWIDNGALDN